MESLILQSLVIIGCFITYAINRLPSLLFTRISPTLRVLACICWLQLTWKAVKRVSSWCGFAIIYGKLRWWRAYWFSNWLPVAHTMVFIVIGWLRRCSGCRRDWCAYDLVCSLSIILRIHLAKVTDGNLLSWFGGGSNRTSGDPWVPSVTVVMFGCPSLLLSENTRAVLQQWYLGDIKFIIKRESTTH